MAAPGLAGPAKKALATLDREWDGLAAHRDYPMIGLDNNTAERMIRGPVVTRKNAGGSRNGDTARNAAVIWTVTATAQMAGLNLLTWLTAYLDECGRNAGNPASRLTTSSPGSPKPESGHLLADAVAFGNFSGLKAPPGSSVQELPGQEEAAGEPVGFLFLVWVAGEEPQAADLLHFFHGMAEDKMGRFVGNIALTAARAMPAGCRR